MTNCVVWWPLRWRTKRPSHTLQPTALVPKAWLRLTGGGRNEWHSRAYFFAAAGEAMRRILIERARRKISAPKAGLVERDELSESRIIVKASSEDLLAVHEALAPLEQEDALAAELVRLRYCVGMSMPESAEATGITARSAERLSTFCKAFIKEAPSNAKAGSACHAFIEAGGKAKRP